MWVIWSFLSEVLLTGMYQDGTSLTEDVYGMLRLYVVEVYHVCRTGYIYHIQ